MKKLATMAAFALSVAATHAQNAEFLITGSVPKDAKMVYYFTNDNYRRQDSVPVNNGRFQLKGKKQLNTFITLWTDRNTFTSVMTDRTPTTVNIVTGAVTGSAENVQFSTFQKKQKSRNDEFMKIAREWEKVAADETIEGVTKKKTLETQLENVEKDRIKDIIDFSKKHQKDMLPAFFISQNQDMITYAQLEELLKNDYAYTSHPILEKTKKAMESMALRKPGLKFTDLEMQDLNGKTVKLSQWVGKGNYVLVDFWASWCGPCRMEMPNVVDSYKRYHAAKGYEVIGVSFDSKADDWKRAVKELGMDWPNMSDLKGWKSAAAAPYGIKSIPANILVDPDGIIVAADLRGNALTAKLKEIYGY
ncbi:MAG: AhpC/TSA family protein [Prevotella sp.]|nr:AhpC/TSA family protein [Prevotella sp.]